MGDTLMLWSMQEITIDEVSQGYIQQIKTLVKRSAQDIYEIGRLLTEVKDRLGHGNFETCIDAEFGWDVRTARNFMRVYETFKSENFSDLNIAPSALYLLASPSTPDDVRDVMMERAQAGEKITFTETKQFINEHRQPTEFLNNPATWQHDYRPIDEREGNPKPVFQSPSPMAVHYSSETPEWYTPTDIVDRVVLALGEIDLDPCSNSRENPNIPANHHLTAEDNGLSYEWGGKVYMNPPYGREIGDWTSYLKQQYECGNVTEAIALVPSRTDTEWFRELRDYPRCFIWGRLKFSESENSAPFPSMVVYFGENLEVFKRAFGDIGDVYCLS